MHTHTRARTQTHTHAHADPNHWVEGLDVSVKVIRMVCVCVYVCMCVCVCARVCVRAYVRVGRGRRSIDNLVYLTRTVFAVGRVKQHDRS